MERRLHVLLCAPYGGVAGGISRWTGHVMEYYRSLQPADIDLSILTTARSAFVNINSAGWSRIRYGVKDYLRIFREYRRQLHGELYDVVHLTSSASWGLAKDIYMLRKARAANLKTVIHFRFGRIPELSEKKNWEWKLLMKAVRLADRVVVIDRVSFETLRSAGFGHVVNLPNPVASTVGTFIEAHSKTVSRANRMLLFAGHVLRTKGIYELVEACREIPGIRLKMIGALLPGIKENLLGLASREGDVSWIEITGERPYEEVLKEMMKCAVFVLPTYTEGFPNVILESMACGSPIVATSVGAIPEMLDDGAGIVIEPRNVEQLRDAISELLESPEQAAAMGAKAVRRVYERYSMPAVWSQLTDLWKGMR